MNETIVNNFKEVVADNDKLFILGDLMLKDNEKGIQLINQLPGEKFIVFGNHDTPTRITLYENEIRKYTGGAYAEMLHYNGYHFYLSHFPSLTGNLEKESLKQVTCNLFGHTHSKDKFYQDIPFMYNVALDAHNCYPIEIEEIIRDMWIKVKECKEML